MLSVDANTTLADRIATVAVRYLTNGRGKLEQLAMLASANSVSVTDTPRNVATILKWNVKEKALVSKIFIRAEEFVSTAR